MIWPLEPTPWTRPIVLAALLAVVVAAGLVYRRARISLIGWMGPSTAVAALGLVGSLMTLHAAPALTAAASPHFRRALAFGALADSGEILALGFQWATLTLAATAWVAALASLRRPGTWRLAPAAGMAGALLSLGALVLVLGQWVAEFTLTLLALVLTGPPMVIALTRLTEDSLGSDLQRVAISLAPVAALTATASCFASGLAITGNALSMASPETLALMLDANLAPLSQLPIGWSGPVVVALAALAWGANLTWVSPDRRRGLLASWGAALGAMAIAAVAIGGSFGTIRSLYDQGAAFGVPLSNSLRHPHVARVDAPEHERVDIIVSRRDLVAGGNWVLDTVVRKDPATGEVVEFEIAPTAKQWTRLQTQLVRLRGYSDTLVAQVDRDIPWTVLDEVAMEAYAIGFEQIEVVAVGPDEVGVLALPRHGRPAPETPVGVYLSTL